jgi:hypothetical protein
LGCSGWAPSHRQACSARTRYWSHNLLYPLVIGLAATLAGRREQELALRATNNALLLLMLAGLLLIPIMPTLVLDRQYAQG